MSGPVRSNESLIYENPLSGPESVSDFVLEGKAKISFPEGHLRLENAESEQLGQKANYVFWCRKEFPADFRLEIDFRPLREPGLAMLFFAASGSDGRSLFDPSLAPRCGEYVQYHHGDINAFHVSFFRRKEKDERSFHTCNLRKSYGLYMAAQGADPIPDAADADRFYRLSLLKKGADVRFAIDGLDILHYHDDGTAFGPRLGGGCIGLRQLAPMIGEYANLRVTRPD
ncbi:MAG: DUF1961 family protein [Clostridia bacterium]|nr:DUF1961 family protein [Clostridia bacterium]